MNSNKEKIIKLSLEVEKNLKEMFYYIEKISSENEKKVLEAFLSCKITSSHFVETTGYGYNDVGREKIDYLYSKIFGCEDALVRTGFVSGTHAIATALFGVLRPKDKILSITGTPYPTIIKTIGLDEENKNENSLKDYNIDYIETNIIKEKSPNFELLKKTLQSNKIKMVYLQRSKGYCPRKAVDIKTIGKINKIIKNINKDIIFFVDNCYGEFVETLEPTNLGADLIAGSLIKNPGGAMAKTGGYIAGKKNLVERCSERLTAPGLKKELGANLNQNKDIFFGVFLAPLFVANAMKTSVFARGVFKKLGFFVLPDIYENMSDIVSVVKMESKERLISFCEGIQKNSPIDSIFLPTPSNMPGYKNKVIMAAGTFINGASLELSADGEINPPYNLFLQGGLSYNAAKLAIINSITKIIDEKLI